MKYLLILAGEAEGGALPGSAALPSTPYRYQQVTEEMAWAGVLVDTGPLKDPSTTITVRLREGFPVVKDEPFAGGSELLEGYYVLDCADLDAAIDWASKIPAAKLGSVEIWRVVSPALSPTHRQAPNAECSPVPPLTGGRYPNKWVRS